MRRSGAGPWSWLRRRDSVDDVVRSRRETRNQIILPSQPHLCLRTSYLFILGLTNDVSD